MPQMKPTQENVKHMQCLFKLISVVVVVGVLCASINTNALANDVSLMQRLMDKMMTGSNSDPTVSPSTNQNSRPVSNTGTNQENQFKPQLRVLRQSSGVSRSSLSPNEQRNDNDDKHRQSQASHQIRGAEDEPTFGDLVTKSDYINNLVNLDGGNSDHLRRSRVSIGHSKSLFERDNSTTVRPKRLLSIEMVTNTTSGSDSSSLASSTGRQSAGGGTMFGSFLSSAAASSMPHLKASNIGQYSPSLPASNLLPASPPTVQPLASLSGFFGSVTTTLLLTACLIALVHGQLNYPMNSMNYEASPFAGSYGNALPPPVYAGYSGHYEEPANVRDNDDSDKKEFTKEHEFAESAKDSKSKGTFSMFKSSTDKDKESSKDHEKGKDKDHKEFDQKDKQESEYASGSPYHIVYGTGDPSYGDEDKSSKGTTPAPGVLANFQNSMSNAWNSLTSLGGGGSSSSASSSSSARSVRQKRNVDIPKHASSGSIEGVVLKPSSHGGYHHGSDDSGSNTGGFIYLKVPKSFVCGGFHAA
ncbi:hypothetical protein GZH46_02854 [Fragariocoptes setiger]|uniref:Uncharacterized protein n=1 Tax=Fragariocoptes setiger TaxID=1670756 RepID=A0ABQ7S5G1_9ACAR|nr:hypothetical protein GZH46_02854 [Fragariocoptes setiger]